MASPLESNGAGTPLTTDRYITGLVTNRNPLRDAYTSLFNSIAYKSGRYDSMWDGINVEISAKLNLVRRYGNSIFNAQNYPPVQRYYSFRTQVDGIDVIRTMVSTAGAVYDATPPGKALIWTKSPLAGKTSFLSVGNTLYMGDGVDQVKWTVSVNSYQPSKLYAAGQFINDSNGNIQAAFGSVAAQVVSTSIADALHPIGFPPSQSNVFLQLAAGQTVPFADTEPVTFQSMTAAAVLNGQTLPILNLGGGLFRVTIPNVPGYSSTPDTGLAYNNGDSNLTGTTAATPPTWSTALNGVTIDGTVYWICKGTAVQRWGLAAPTQAPTVNQIPAMEPYPFWAPSTYYFTQGIVLDPSNALLVQLTKPGTTGSSAPTFNPTVGHLTVDGTAAWTTIYNGAFPTHSWQAGVGQFLGDYRTALVGGVSYVFEAVLAGTTGATQPAFTAVLGSQVTDGTVVWENVGALLNYSTIPSSQAIQNAQTILDPAGYAQNLTISGISGSAAPTWNDTGAGFQTTDGTVTWTNGGPFATAAASVAFYAYSFKNSVTQTESNLSPVSAAFLQRALFNALVSGAGSTDTQADMIVIYRTVRGGSTFLFDGEIPLLAPGQGGAWNFLDTVTDAGLNLEIQGAINQTNNPPPVGLVNLRYHMGRLWGSVGNLQYFATGPDASVGEPNEAFSPSNVFALPDAIARSEPWDLPNGVLLVFTAGEPYAIWGTGTDSSPFYPKVFTQGAGLLSEDALCVAGGWIAMFTTDQRVLYFQPNANYSQSVPGSDDAGAPIGDQFLKVTTGGISAQLYTPAGTFVTWHAAGTNDVGLFVSDGAVGWFRFSPLNGPENGFIWNPRAAIEHGTSAVQSIETSPGVKKLLIGPPQLTDPVLQITGIEITGGVGIITHSNLFLPLENTPIALAGLTTVPALNDAAVQVVSATTGHFTFDTTQPDQAPTSETGTATVPGKWVASGPILKRDASTNADNGTAYSDTYATIGSVELCQPTEVAAVKAILLDAIRVGTLPTVAVLLGEINPTTAKPFIPLERTSYDPPLLEPSETLFNPEFHMLQNGHEDLCRHMQLKIQLASEDAPSEVLSHTIYGMKELSV